jgi:hypothetical protein
MLQMKTPPTPKVHKQLRVTVPITPEVLALFQRLSEASGKSVGKLMGEWLDETRDGLEPMIEIMTSFKKTPKAAVQALQLHANALTEMVANVVSDAMRLDPDEAAAGGRQAKRDASRAASGFIGKGGLTPPSSNTGGKGRETPKKSKGDSK